MSDFETWSQTTEEGRWICDGESATQLRVYKDIFDHAYEAGRKAGLKEAAEMVEQYEYDESVLLDFYSQIAATIREKLK